MNISKMILTIGKLILCGLVFIVGMIIGGMIAELLGLQSPEMPAGADSSIVIVYFVIISPILALALACIARGLSGTFLTRTLVLSSLTFVAYNLNTLLDAMLYLSWTNSSTTLYSIVTFLIPSFLVGAAIAYFFSFVNTKDNFFHSLNDFFKSRTKKAWTWRLAIAALSYMPIYIFFGKLVLPITGEYYEQEMYQLQLPSWEQIIPILLMRSILFFLACFPVILMWRKSAKSLIFNLGFALFILIGFVYMFSAYWMPISIRIPHALEILGSSFVHAGVLVWLLTHPAITSKARPKFPI